MQKRIQKKKVVRIKNKTFGLIVLGIFIIIVIFSIAGNTIKVPYTVTESYIEKEPYTIKEPYEVQEPYTDIEYYYEKEPYADQDCTSSDYSYSVENSEYHYWSFSDTTCWVKADIVNYEDQGGSFRAYATFTLEGPDFKYDKNHWVYANSRETVTAFYDCGMTEDISLYALKVNPPKKTTCVDVTRYRDVRKSRTVTKYETVIKYEDVTKYTDVEKTRTVTKYQSLFESWGF